MSAPGRQRDLLIFDIVRDGHRRDYFRVLRRVLGGQVVWGSLRERWCLLVRARQLLCSTCDDYLAGFFLLALSRAMVGRPTVGLSVRSETIFQRHGLAQAVKRCILLVLRQLPGVQLVTMMPHWVEPRLRQYTDHWLYDMQYWDVRWLAEKPRLPLNDLARRLDQAAAGRRVVASIGHLRQVKGVAYLMALNANPVLRQHFLFACIGPNWDLPDDQVKAFTAQGGLFLNLELQDDQMIPLYGLIDWVWACYRPDYDQSSGIFGRALQLEKPTVVRQGSYLARLQQDMTPSGVAIPYGDVAAAAKVMLADVPRRPVRQKLTPEDSFGKLQALMNRPGRLPRRPE